MIDIDMTSNYFEFLCYVFYYCRSKTIIHVYRGCVTRLILLIQNDPFNIIWNINVEVVGSISINLTEQRLR